MTTDNSSRARDRAAQLFADAEFEADVMRNVVRTVSSETTDTPPLSALLWRGTAPAQGVDASAATPHTGYDNLRATLPNFVNAGASSLLEKAATQWQRTNALSAARLDAHYRLTLEAELAAANANANLTAASATNPVSGASASSSPFGWTKPGTILDENGNPITES